MKYGLALPYTTPRTVAKLSQLAEKSGWDGCFLGDAIWCEDPMICPRRGGDDDGPNPPGNDDHARAAADSLETGK